MDYHLLPTWPRMTKKDQLAWTRVEYRGARMILGSSTTVSGSIACREARIYPPAQRFRYLWFKRALRCRRLDSSLRKQIYENTWQHSIWPRIVTCMNDWTHLRHCGSSNLISPKNSWSNISPGSQVVLTCWKRFLRDVWLHHLVSRFNSERKNWRPMTGNTAIANLWILKQSTAIADFVVLRKSVWLTTLTTVPASELFKPEEYSIQELLHELKKEHFYWSLRDSPSIWRDLTEPHSKRKSCTLRGLTRDPRTSALRHEFCMKWSRNQNIVLKSKYHWKSCETHAKLCSQRLRTSDSTAKTAWKHLRSLDEPCPELSFISSLQRLETKSAYLVRTFSWIPRLCAWDLGPDSN